ncbi:MAG: porin family protein [Deltaproteobacteria bacterium]|nr:porin family protein [Deltaproteobacteria bacterium]
MSGEFIRGGVNFGTIVLSALFAITISSTNSEAQSRRPLIGDIVPREQIQERIPVQPERREERKVAPAPAEDEWGVRVSPGVTVWFFDKEDTEVGPAGYMDIWNKEYPINFRVGVEGRHLYLSQPEAQGSAEFFDKTPDITFIRIPFALEYIVPVDEQTDLFFGVGPDIIHGANDVSDTSVGMHLEARLGYDFADNWGVALAGGYMWGELEGRDGADIELDTAYVSPFITYTF